MGISYTAFQLASFSARSVLFKTKSNTRDHQKITKIVTLSNI